MTTTIDSIWVGLMTDAGEVAWPSYKRVRIGKDRPVKVRFTLEVKEPVPIEVFNRLGFYSTESDNGKTSCIKTIETTHMGNPLVKKGDVISFQIL